MRVIAFGPRWSPHYIIISIAPSQIEKNDGETSLEVKAFIRLRISKQPNGWILVSLPFCGILPTP